MNKKIFLTLAATSVLMLSACTEVETKENVEVKPVEEVNPEKKEVEKSKAAEPVVENEKSKEEEPVVKEEPKEESVPREYKAALATAQGYVDMMDFSEKGLYKQMTSEYGSQYPEDATKYAMENVKVDYNQEALEAAQAYIEFMPMSDAQLLEQLTSEYGSQFTKEQAEYALANLK